MNTNKLIPFKSFLLSLTLLATVAPALGMKENRTSENQSKEIEITNSFDLLSNEELLPIVEYVCDHPKYIHTLSLVNKRLYDFMRDLCKDVNHFNNKIFCRQLNNPEHNKPGNSLLICYAPIPEKNPFVFKVMTRAMLKTESCKEGVFHCYITSTNRPNELINQALKLLTELGFDPNKDYSTTHLPTLHFATLYGTPESVQILLDAGADLDQKDWHKRTPLDVAKQVNNPETIKLIEDAMKKKKNK